MEQAFWLERWQSGRIGFHRDAPLPWLVRHWPDLQLAPGSRVLVPLAGKSQDMIWLAAQGFRVLGVELSPIAVAQFLAENGLTAAEHSSDLGRHHVAGPIEIIQGDIFALDAEAVAGCSAVYDRAALIALPPVLRRRYADLLTGILPAGTRMLLVTLDYEPGLMEGPPFAMTAGDVTALYGDAWQIETLEIADILAENPGFIARGAKWLQTGIYRLERR